MDILDFTSHFLYLYLFVMCFFFSFCIKSAKRDKNSNSVQILCLFFTVCLKAQKSFNYYIIKMKSKLAFVILRKILFRSDLVFCDEFCFTTGFANFLQVVFQYSAPCILWSPYLLLSLWVPLKLVKFVFASLKCVLDCSICVF